MEPIAFEWWRCIDGYTRDHVPPPRSWQARPGQRKWKFKRGPPGSSLGGITSLSERFERYEPLKVGALFRVFADMPATPEGMLAFANEYGLLEHGEAGITYISTGIDPLLEHHAALRRAIYLYEIGDMSELIKRVNAGWGHNARWGQMRVEWRLRPDGRLGHVFVPLNLIHAMWLQFAQHVESGTKLLKCNQCGKPFEVGSGTGRRETAIYCSSACRQAAFKARQEA